MLEPLELQQLNHALQRYLVGQRTTTQHTAFHQALLESGLVRQIKRSSFEPSIRQPLIQAQGEPVSQTIIEERR